MKVVIYIYNGLTMLDAIGPYEVLRNIEGAEIYFVAEKKGEIKADSNFVHINAKYDIDDIKDADVLLIPGSTITFIREMKNKRVLNWIKMIDKTTKWTTSVCSGSLILASTGVLKGKKATSHWKPIKLLKEFKVIPKRERIVEQGKYITAAGVSAGIDMALYLADKIVGELETKAIQLVIEYDPSPKYKSGNFTNADKEVIKMAEIKLEKDAKKEVRLLDLIKSGRTIMKIKKS
ncbi:DJ-1/PfpI family protein [Maribacter litoralis]|uniref:DJ-1/PfpI family protein n=1 Tax=Maribacter litoralis TaxID=2059726 RepID=UPI000E3180B8|nr:DJ-1/PfpI family protein [Maribacter litoralis]